MTYYLLIEVQSDERTRFHVRPDELPKALESYLDSFFRIGTSGSVPAVKVKAVRLNLVDKAPK
jgi:hypothetical protein